ncbi:alkaline phosphatase family protein [Prevotella aff. ruminicola Tc2-24]|nr:alkaline phosphatase family protein [Prevotella aff. ruminicola Tc2-24]
MKKLLLLIVMMCAAAQLPAHNEFGERPKLVVGIVVDQMRWDYLSRYYDQFQDDGFRRLIDKGFSCNNCLINYVPTVTAIGHTSAYTGTTPAFHGICGNNFFIDGEPVYCCADQTVEPVGTDNAKRGKMSPRNLLSTTIGDQLRMHTDFRSKVIGVSYKDRAAILPAGRSSDAAFWLDIDNGQFITSTYYMTELPEWAKAYNRELKKNKRMQELGKRIGYDPLCGTITTEMAIAALQGEQLGKGDVTDMLCVSYSQTDVIGHEWGTRGEHTDGAYLQLDRDIARLLKALDDQVGEGNYLVFLTADHGAAHNYQYMEDHKMNGGAWKGDIEMFGSGLEGYLKETLGADLSVINSVNGYRVFLNKKRIAELGLEGQKVKDAIIGYARQMPHVQFVMDFEKVNTWSVPDIIRSRALLGYHPRRSGDILLVLEAGYYEFWSGSSKTGTTHGEWNPYDAHIPLLFYGWKVDHGSTSREVHITDIAPTVCQMLHIQQTNACIGEAIPEVVR